MPRWVKAAAIAELPPGTVKGVRVGEREVLLANVGGNYYAAQDRCPHLGWRLSKGTLEGGVLTCPGHGSRFDLATGQVVRWATGLTRFLRPPHPLTTYPVKVEGDSILVEV